MVLIGVLTNCNSGDLLAIASIIDMAKETDRLHIRIYGQNGNTKFGIITLMYNIIKKQRVDKHTIPIEISRYRGDYEKRYADNCLGAMTYNAAKETIFVELPREGFDKLFAFSELEEIFSVSDDVLQIKLFGQELYLYADYKNLKAKYIIAKDIQFSHKLTETNIKFLFTKFHKIFYFTNKMVLGDHMTTTLHQHPPKNDPLMAWYQKISEGNELFEFFGMVTKNDNLTSNKKLYKNVTTAINIVPFAIVYLPEFTTLFISGSFCGLDKVTLEPKFIMDANSVEEWYVLKDEKEKHKILYDCLCAYFSS